MDLRDLVKCGGRRAAWTASSTSWVLRWSTCTRKGPRGPPTGPKRPVRGGYDVSVARDGAAGSHALAAGAFDVVLLDLGLPFVDGWRILAGLEPGRIPSVIVISARGEERAKVRALDMGADNHLAKPFGADELLLVSGPCSGAPTPTRSPSRSSGWTTSRSTSGGRRC